MEISAPTIALLAAAAVIAAVPWLASVIAATAAVVAMTLLAAVMAIAFNLWAIGWLAIEAARAGLRAARRRMERPAP